jgi:chemotaxis protein CheD
MIRARTPTSLDPERDEPAAVSERVPKVAADGRARKSVQLYAGQLVASAEPSMVTTILGSCVAVCLWDRGKAIGGINHFLLPDKVGGDQFSARFGSVACKRLIERMAGLGSVPHDLQAKVFGGASVLDAFRGGTQQLGAKNVEMALAVLAHERIAVVATDVGGRFGRRLVYFTDTGAAWVKTIQRGLDGP